MPPVITTGFTNKNGEYLDRVREIAFQKDNLLYNLGKFITETKHESNYFFKEDFIATGVGVYIYQSIDNPNIAYRIYKEFSDYGFNGYSDDKLIQLLQEKQEKIKLTEFPTGVVTLGGNIIGQEIPYYEKYITIFNYFQTYYVDNPFKVYIAMLEILKEMYDEQILYLDVHPKNFMISKDNFNVKMIDFDENYIKFEQLKVYRETLFSNIKNMIDCLNKICQFDDLVFLQTDNFDDCLYQVKQMKKRLHK